MGNNEYKLHLACGPNIVKGWENIDILKNPGIKNADLRKPLPYTNDSVSAIFHEHFIEHLTKQEAQEFLRECHRVLRPGSAMRIGWPDLQRLMRAYATRSKKYKKHALPYLENHLFGENWDEIFSDCLFNWDHRYAYTAKHLKLILVNIGFRNVKVMRYRNSAYSIALDFRNDPATTYLEMIK